MLPQTHHQVHCALHTVHRRDGVPDIIIIITIISIITIITIITIIITIIIITIIIIIIIMSYLLLMSVAPHMAQPWVEHDWR